MASAGRRKRVNRFDNYDPTASLSEIELVGLVNNQLDYDLGTPCLSRQEDITLVSSSSSHLATSILVEFKWRPCNEQSGIVCLWAHLLLHLGNQQPDCHYEYEQVITYRPTRSTIRPGRILQYGSHQSALKLHISAPYRRSRLTFNGSMMVMRAGESVAVERVKLNLLVNPTSGLFDFKEEVPNPQAAHDRHEQLVQIKGEYQIGAEPERKKLITWGFYSREFKQEEVILKRVRERRVFAHLNTGLAFHLGCLGEVNGFGYYTTRGDSGLYPLKDFSKMYLSDDFDEQEMSLEVKLGDKSNTNICLLKQRKPLRNIYDIQLDRKWRGWALVSSGVHKSVEQRVNSDMEQSVRRYLEALAAGRLAQTVQGLGLSSLSYRNMKPLVVGLTDSRCTCSDLVGSKAASLAHLRRLQNALGPASHYMVPHAFVLTRYANEAILESNPTLVQAIERLEKLLAHDSISLTRIKDECESLVKLTEDAQVPERLKADLLYFLDAQFQNGHHFRFAVRSSSWAEDDDDMSGAGQLSTYLGVQGLEEILKAAIKCFASKFSFANVEYKRQHGLGPNVPMAVVVQELIDCEKAGVLFTCDPQSGDTSLMTITANYGLGESVVSGQSEPDSIKVRLMGNQLIETAQITPQIEQVCIGQKLQITTLANGSSSSSSSLTSSSNSETTQPTNNDGYDRSKCCLKEAEILKLANCGLSVDKFFEGPRDIEWGYLGAQLYLFQARPITNLDTPTEFQLLHENDQPTRAEVELCTRANVGEVIPSAIKPLTFTQVFRTWSLFGPRMERTIKFLKSRKFNPECSETTLNHSYHMFLLLAGRRQLLYQRTGKKSLAQKATEVGIFGHELDHPELKKVFEEENQNQQVTKLGMLLFTFLTRQIRRRPKKVALKERTKLSKARDEIRQMNHLRSDNKLTFLYEQMKNCLEYGYSTLGNHGLCIVIANEYNGDLMGTLSKYIDDPVRIYSILAKFLAVPRVISAEIPERIDKMAKLIKSRGPDHVERFLKMSHVQALNYLEANDNLSASDDDLNKEFREFMNKFGHRCYNEFDIKSHSWREAPGEVVEMIRKNCASSGVVRAREQQEAANWRRVNDKIINSLDSKNLSFMDRQKLRYFQVPRCQLFVSVRELTKDILIEYMDLIRESTRLLAQEMRRQLRVPEEDLMYYMLLDELEPLIREPQPALVVQAKRRRQMFKSLFKEPWLFDEVIAGPSFTPNQMKAQNELDRRLLDADKLHGTPASSGRVQGKVCLVRQYSELDKVSPDDILVAHSTDIAFSPIFPLLSGIVTEVGGIISHGAVVAREYGLPSILGVPNVTKILQDGEEIILDADNGCIIRLSTN